MTPGDEQFLQVGRPLDVTVPGRQRGFAIPDVEWAFLRSKVEAIANPGSIFLSLGWTLVGIAGSALLAFLTVPHDARVDGTPARHLCLGVLVFALLSGGLSLLFAFKQRGVLGRAKGDALDEMTRIETIYGRPGGPGDAPRQARPQSEERRASQVGRPVGQLGGREGGSNERTVTVVGTISSTYFFNADAPGRCLLGSSFVVVSAQPLHDLYSLLSPLEQVAASDRALLIIAPEVVGEALATLITNNKNGVVRYCAFNCRGGSEELRAAAKLAGTRIFGDEAGLRLAPAKINQLGAVDSVEADGTKLVLRKEST